MRNILRSIPSPPTSTPRKGSRLTVLGEPPAAHHQAATSENLGAQLSPEDLAEIIGELRAEGHKSTVTQEGNTLRTVFQVEGLQVVFEEPARQSRVHWGDDGWGFFIKLEYWEQLAIAGASYLAGGPVGAGIRIVARKLISLAIKKGVRLGAVDGVVRTIFVLMSDPCGWGQAKTVYFSPVRVYCG